FRVGRPKTPCKRRFPCYNSLHIRRERSLVAALDSPFPRIGDIGMRLVAKFLGLTLFCGTAVFGATPAGAMLITQPASANATLCVDVRGSSTILNAVVWVYPCNATIAEQWHFVGAQLQGLMPNRCLATQNGRIADGTPVVLSACTGRPWQS